MDVRKLIELRKAHELGHIGRHDFRKRFAEVSDNIELVRASLEGSQIKSIEINADAIVLGLHSGVRLEWELKDIGSAATVAIYHGSYELQETELLSALAENHQVVVDVGANIGWYAIHLAKRLSGPSPRVYAFEPVSRNFNGLRRNIQLNGLEDVIHPLNLGMGDRAGDLSFYVPTDLPGAASLAELHPSLSQEQQTCQITTLDAILEDLRAPKVGLIKCDVEGAELSVMKGGIRRIARDRPIIMLELLRKWSRAFGYHPNDVFHLLADIGYRACAVGKGPPRWVGEVTEDTLETNFLMLTSSHQREREILARFGCADSDT